MDSVKEKIVKAKEKLSDIKEQNEKRQVIKDELIQQEETKRNRIEVVKGRLQLIEQRKKSYMDEL